MAYCRCATLILLLAVVGVPVALPFVEALQSDQVTLSVSPQRYWLLYRSTGFLVVGTLALALPIGVLAAVLLYRTELPAARLFRFLVLLSLFVPLPVLTTAWQTALGSIGIWTVSGRPWSEGLGPAIWIHAQAAIPWVILIVGQGLRSVPSELEEDALLATGPRGVLWHVTLPQCRGAIAAAGIWIALQTAAEIGVADLMLVDTIAREVYNQFTLGQDGMVARALLVSLPIIAATTLGLCWLLTRLDRLLPPLDPALRLQPKLKLINSRWLLFLIAATGVLVLAGVPLAALVWRTGLVSYPPQWSFHVAWSLTERTLLGDGRLLVTSIVTMFLSAGLIATLALLICWLAQDASWYRRLIFVVLVLAWSMPGPILGIGLKETVMHLVLTVPFTPLSIALYDGPSPLPTIWAHVIRFLPLAVVAIWPAVRLIPRELRDSMRIDGATPFQELSYLTWPFVRRTWLVVVVIVAALALGEIGAVAMRVETPGWETFAHVLFARMHYGQAADVAALCLGLVLIVSAGGFAAVISRRFVRLWLKTSRLD